MRQRFGNVAMLVTLAVMFPACGGDDTTDGVERGASVSVAPAQTALSAPSTAPSTSTVPVGWSAAPPLLHPRSSHGVVELDGALFALAGTDENGDPLPEVERFDGAAWAVVTTMPGDGVNAPSVAAVAGRVYVIGGFKSKNGRPTDEVRVYDPATAAWTNAAPLPTASGGHAAAVVDGRIHVIGGGTAVSTIADHVVYDPQTDSWTPAAPLPQAEGSPAAVVFNGALWSIGGRSGYSDFGDVFVYDATTDSWTAGPSIEPRGTAGAVVLCGTIFLVGGESQATKEVLADVLRLDGDTWVAMEALPTPRSFARAVVLDGVMYVVGGSQKFGRSHASPGSGAVERYNPDC